MHFWIENSWFSIGYLKTRCDGCRFNIWKLGLVVASLDNTNDGFCPNCSSFVDS